jgi:hypothetical protein
MSYSYGKSIVTDGLVFYVDAANENSYPGSGTTWSDLVGSVSASSNNVGATNHSSSNGGVFSLDGTNEHFSFLDASLDYDRSNFSVEAWVRPTGNHSNFETGVFTKWNTGSGTDNEFFLGFWNSSGPAPFAFAVQSPQGSGGTNGSGNFIVNSTFNYIVNRWYHLVGTFDGPNSTLKLYVNGALADTDTTFNDTQAKTVTTKYYIGAFEVRVSVLADIAKCALYSKTLSASEVTQNYNALKNRFI